MSENPDPRPIYRHALTVAYTLRDYRDELPTYSALDTLSLVAQAIPTTFYLDKKLLFSVLLASHQYGVRFGDGLTLTVDESIEQDLDFFNGRLYSLLDAA